MILTDSLIEAECKTSGADLLTKSIQAVVLWELLMTVPAKASP